MAFARKQIMSLAKIFCAFTLSFTILKPCEAVSYNNSAPWDVCEGYGQLGKNYTIPDVDRRGSPFLRAAVRGLSNDSSFGLAWKPLCTVADQSIKGFPLGVMLSIEYTNRDSPLTNQTEPQTTNISYAVLGDFITFVSPSDIATLVPSENDTNYAIEPVAQDFGHSQCTPLYNYIFEGVAKITGRNALNLAETLREAATIESLSELGLLGNIYYALVNATGPPIDKIIGTDPLQCPFLIDKPMLGTAYCTYEQSAFTQDQWNEINTDSNFQAFINGGADSDGVWWPGRSFFNESQSLGSSLLTNNFVDLSTELGVQLLGQRAYSCSLESACPGPSECNLCGSRTTLGLAATEVLPSRWGYFVLQAFAVFNKQLVNNYQALQGAAINAALESFSIGDYYPHSDASFKLEGILAGLTLGLSIFSAVVPLAAGVPALTAVGGLTKGVAVAEAAGEALAAVSNYIGEGLGRSKDDLAIQKTYADRVRDIYNSLVKQLDAVGNTLLSGKPISNNFTIVDLMRGGTWATSVRLPNITSLERSLRIEIFARSINSLWKVYSSNKMWLTFTLLPGTDANTTCQNDRSGPQDMKLCRDGGVYYAYNFIEDGDGQGHVGYPWGADKLEKLELSKDMIMQASANTYRLAKEIGANNTGIDVFNISYADLSTSYLKSGDLGFLDGYAMAGRYPGSWTLPVCNVSTWGGRWNWNYNEGRNGSSHPPCLCGDGGKETAASANAAGMKNFGTFYSRCDAALSRLDFAWPDGVKGVDLGFGAPLKRHH